MAPSRRERWLRDLKSVQSCLHNFRTRRPKDCDECRNTIANLEYYHQVLKKLSSQKFPLKWLNHILFLRQKYPLAIDSAYKEFNILEKLAVVDMEKLTTGESELCMICLEELEGTGNVRKVLVCNHMYHADCIFKWFFKHKTCPICRAVAVDY